jgi:hypothetical protein
MNPRLLRSVLTTAVVLGTAGAAHADLRSFTETYEFATTPAGRTAVEIWHTQGRFTNDASSPQFVENILELEHGITDRWDIAFYQVFEQVTGEMDAEAFHFAETKLETRYKLAERGEWPVDTLLYLEVAKEFGESEYELEGKVIGARDFDRLTVAANAIVEVKVGKDVDETEPEFGWAVGATYEIHPKLRLGAETWGEAEEDELALAAGPAISIAAASNFWVAFTAGFGLTDEAEGFRARAIVGIEL